MCSSSIQRCHHQAVFSSVSSHIMLNFSGLKGKSNIQWRYHSSYAASKPVVKDCLAAFCCICNDYWSCHWPNWLSFPSVDSQLNMTFETKRWFWCRSIVVLLTRRLMCYKASSPISYLLELLVENFFCRSAAFWIKCLAAAQISPQGLIQILKPARAA